MTGFVEDSLPHGSKLLLGGEPRRPLALRDPRGTTLVEAQWDDAGGLVLARVRVPPARLESWLVVRADEEQHAVFGDAFRIGIIDPSGAEHLLTSGGAIDWGQPSFIPPLERPGALPPGGGTAVLGWLALLMDWNRAGRVRYRGPYPSARLFDALLECFTPAEPSDVVAARRIFLDDAEGAAFSGWPVEPKVSFQPAPFERVFDEKADAVVQLRGRAGEARAIERVFIGAVAFEGARGGLRPTGSRVLRPAAGADAGAWASARVEIFGEPWRFVATVDARGRVLWCSDAGRRLAPSVLGDGILDPRWLWVVTGILARRAPRALAPAIIRTLGPETRVRWGDPGDDVAALEDGMTPADAAAAIHRGHVPTIDIHAGAPARCAERAARETHPKKRIDQAKALLAEVTRGLEPLVASIAQARIETEGLAAFASEVDEAAGDPFAALDAETASLLVDVAAGKCLPDVRGDVGPPRTDRGQGVAIE